MTKDAKRQRRPEKGIKGIDRRVKNTGAVRKNLGDINPEQNNNPN